MVQHLQSIADGDLRIFIYFLFYEEFMLVGFGFHYHGILAVSLFDIVLVS